MTPSWAIEPRIGAMLGGRTNAYAFGKNPAEAGRPEQDAADHLADDRRLSQPPEQPADEPAGNDDGRQREQQMGDQIRSAARRRTDDEWLTRCRSGELLAVVPNEQEKQDGAENHGAVGKARPRRASLDYGHPPRHSTAGGLLAARARSPCARPGRPRDRHSRAESAACRAGTAIPSEPRRDPHRR